MKVNFVPFQNLQNLFASTISASPCRPPDLSVKPFGKHLACCLEIIIFFGGICTQNTIGISELVSEI